MPDPTTAGAARHTRTLLIGALVVAAVAVGIGAGALLAGRPGASASASPSDVAAVPTASPTDVPPTPTPTPTVAPAPTPEPTPTLVAAALTGLLVTEAAAAQHPIAVMVDDQQEARPQSGFNAASIVWQAPAEGGIPRYMLIFQDGLPSAVGPIRSARQYYIEWASEWKALYVHIGGSPQALTTLRTSGRGQLVYNADGFRFEGSDMWRIKERPSPHNLYSDGAHLRAMAAKVGATDGPVTPIWQFATSPSSGERPTGTRIVLHYPYETITYVYDPGTNTYRRFIDKSTTPQIDAADGREVRPTNVVVLRMRFGPLNDGNPLKHRLEAQDVGSGEAIISTGGRVIHGTWKKAAAAAPTLLFGPDGTPARLTAGQTFVQVMALSYAYEVSVGAVSGTGLGER